MSKSPQQSAATPPTPEGSDGAPPPVAGRSTAQRAQQKKPAAKKVTTDQRRAKQPPAKARSPRPAAAKASRDPLPKAPVKPGPRTKAKPATAKAATPVPTDPATVTPPRPRPAPGPASPAPPAPQPVVARPSRRSWFDLGRRPTRLRTAIVVAPLMVGLVVAGAFGARLMYADPAPASVPDPDVTCWDRTRAPVDECTLPTGVEGLAWVYPSFDPRDTSCADLLPAHPEYARPTMWRCEAERNGRPLRITYSELTSIKSGLAYHKKLFADGKLSAFPGRHGTVDRYVWRLPEPEDGWYRMAAMYVDFPYAVLVEASTLRDRDRTYRDLVRQRDPRHVTTRFS